MGDDINLDGLAMKTVIGILIGLLAFLAWFVNAFEKQQFICREDLDDMFGCSRVYYSEKTDRGYRVVEYSDFFWRFGEEKKSSTSKSFTWVNTDQRNMITVWRLKN